MSEPIFLFPCDYFQHQLPDLDYKAEYESALAKGFQVLLFDLTAFLVESSIHLPAVTEEKTVIYRGWMMTVAQYQGFYRALAKHNYYLINEPGQYRQCHCLPFWYAQLVDFTPKSVWSEGQIDQAGILAMLQNFGEEPVMVKDYVKSRKHEWDDCFYIPHASDETEALRVIANFLERQGEDLQGGLVLRRYHSLKMIGQHSQSGMPLAKEVRVFCYKHQPFCYLDYWSTQTEFDRQSLQKAIEASAVLDSSFYTVDLAQTTEGDWLIIEVGDGQVSGLQAFSANTFYESFSKAIQEVASRDEYQEK